MSFTADKSGRPIAARVVLSFLATVVLCHFAATAWLPHVARLLRRIPGYQGDPLASALPIPRPRFVVIGSSLSGRRGDAPTFATELARSLHVPESDVLNLSYGDRSIGDLFAELVRARKLGGDAVIEINPIIIYDRTTFEERHHLRVATEPDRSLTIYPHVRAGLRWKILWQLGVDGLLGQARNLWAPSRFHFSLTRHYTYTSVVGGLYPLVADLTLGNPTATPGEGIGYCDHFSETPEYGVDTAVLEDLFRYATLAAPNTIFFLAPMNRHAILNHCGPDEVKRLDAVIDDVDARARQAHVRLIDLSNLFDFADVFSDYGHYKREKRPWAYAQWAAKLIPLLPRQAPGPSAP